MFYKLLTVTALVATLVSIVAAANPPDCDRSYEVQGGDTCDSICAKNHVSDYQLQLVNPEMVCDHLYLGEKLCLGRKGQDCTDVHTVSSGENCWKIAHDAGITIELLVENNPNLGKNCQFVRFNEVVCIAKKKIPYTKNPPPKH